MELHEIYLVLRDGFTLVALVYLCIKAAISS